jgi:uncharacterized protein (TIGR02145 family)
LYNWATAMKACPNGWHLPSQEEWDSLDFGNSETAGKKLKAVSGWADHEGKSGNGIDMFGFSALPGGYGRSDGSFGDVSHLGRWWSSSRSEYDSNDAYSRYIGYISDGAYWVDIGKGHLPSVRCVKD